MCVDLILFQTERAFQKQPTVFMNKKAILQGKSKKTLRYVRNVGLGFKTPREVRSTFSLSENKLRTYPRPIVNVRNCNMYVERALRLRSAGYITISSLNDRPIFTPIHLPHSGICKHVFCDMIFGMLNTNHYLSQIYTYGDIMLSFRFVKLLSFCQQGASLVASRCSGVNLCYIKEGSLH